MNYSLAAFQEPRGVMRILQFIFAICAFATTTNFSASLTVQCGNTAAKQFDFDYPFRIGEGVCLKTSDNSTLMVSGDVSSDARFFVATGVLSLMYCLFIIFVYAVLDELYKSKSEIPLADFMLTTILAIFWLSGSAAWSNGANALKSITDTGEIESLCTTCKALVGSFSRLNISLIFGYLNFFLWASDLWFLYKETIWFQGRPAVDEQGTSNV